jgi:hypothetical protein
MVPIKQRLENIVLPADTITFSRVKTVSPFGWFAMVVFMNIFSSRESH